MSCPDCNGSGEYVGLNHTEKCETCGGSGKEGTLWETRGWKAPHISIPIEINVLDSTNQMPLPGARVYMVSMIGGPLKEGTVLVDAHTDPGGRVYFPMVMEVDQPVTASVTMSIGGISYKTAFFISTITDAGLKMNIRLARD